MNTRPTSQEDSSEFEPEADGSAEQSAHEDRDGSDPQSRAQLDTLQAERDNLFQRLARAQAEFQNARRRLDADREQAVAYANSSLIKSLLPVIDNFERALSVNTGKTDAAAILKGMQIVHDQWMTVLKNQFVETISPLPGTPFDANTMEALLQQPHDKYPPNTVTQVLQNGYALHGRTLRPAQVAVTKAE
jgi:molecular chaperone GrpE